MCLNCMIQSRSSAITLDTCVASVAVTVLILRILTLLDDRIVAVVAQSKWLV